MTQLEALEHCLSHLESMAKYGDDQDSEAASVIHKMIISQRRQRDKNRWGRWNAGLSPNRLDKWNDRETKS